jgi:CheY-like chemotaxis protein
MGQVLMNLATNARDAMPEGGRMTFATSAVVLGEEFCRQYAEVTPGDYIRLKVSDSGQGMDQHTLEHMYDPFFTTKAVGKGTGLGLSTIHGIVKSHGGHIFCSSAPGRGTSFDIYLPALAQNLADPAGEGETGPQESGAGRRILLVDDEESLRTLGTRALQTADYEVVAVSSGEEALQAYRQGPPWPDVVVLDLGMPGMGGVRCLKAMLEINPRAKVLVASGYAADAQVKDALAAGAVDYVAKPFQRGELLGKIWQLLRGDGKA